MTQPLSWGHTPIPEMDFGLITQESHHFSRGNVKTPFVRNYIEANLDGTIHKLIFEAEEMGEFHCKKCDGYFNYHMMETVNVRLDSNEPSGEGICGLCAKNSFRYGGKVFTPFRKLTSKELRLESSTKYLRSDRKLNLSTYVGTYTWEGFHDASPEKDYDLFKCEDNGKIYIPCLNELFEYTKPIN